jgi:hypothetical protein
MRSSSLLGGLASALGFLGTSFRSLAASSRRTSVSHAIAGTSKRTFQKGSMFEDVGIDSLEGSFRVVGRCVKGHHFLGLSDEQEADEGEKHCGGVHHLDIEGGLTKKEVLVTCS